MEEEDRVEPGGGEVGACPEEEGQDEEEEPSQDEGGEDGEASGWRRGTRLSHEAQGPGTTTCSLQGYLDYPPPELVNLELQYVRSTIPISYFRILNPGNITVKIFRSGKNP